MATVLSGLDVLRINGFRELRGTRVGVLANQASVDANFDHLVDLLVKSGTCTVVRLFAPEHGFRGELQDMDKVDHGIDPYTGLPIISLYGSDPDSLSPKESDLADLDVLVVDLPDIGTRYYTFAQSMAYAMAKCAHTGTRVIVLDRPNPLNGLDIEGNLLRKFCRSFCGFAPVPNRHGLTLGELAELLNRGFGEGEERIPAISCSLSIVKAQGWTRGMFFDQTGLPWVLPSPNMPTLDTALVYPGTCLFEATTISEGRGTTRPFEILGAPYIDGARWAEATLREEVRLEGVKLRPLSFFPKFNKHANTFCGGVQIHVTDRAKFRPYRLALALLSSAARLYPSDFSWRPAPYEFVKDVPAIDLLHGSPSLRELISRGGPLSELEPELIQYEEYYRAARHPFMLYA